MDAAYLKSIAENLEALAGTSGAEENMTTAGYLKRIEDATAALELSAVPTGTAMPGSPAEGALIRRSDLGGRVFRYDGTRWLSTESYVIPFGNGSYTASSALYAAIPFKGVHGLWLESWTVMIQRNAAGEWDVVLQSRVQAGGLTVLDTRDGSADADGQFMSATRALNTVLDANANLFVVSINEISGAATAVVSALLTYRLIGV